MTVFYVAPKVLGTHSAPGATGSTGSTGADVGRTQERSEQSAIAEITSIHGVLHRCTAQVYCLRRVHPTRAPREHLLQSMPRSAINEPR